MRQLGLVRGSLLAFLPLGAFFIGPALAAFAPVGAGVRVPSRRLADGRLSRRQDPLQSED